MKIQTLQIKDLTPDPSNARQHDDKNLKAIQGSLNQFGQRKPIVITEDGVIVAGNGTVEAAKRLGWLEIQAVTVPGDWTPEQTKAFALADNRTAELAAWNTETLTAQLQELEEKGWEIADFGFEALDFPTEDPVVIEDEIPELAPQRVALGDVWQLGNHRLVCGDSTTPAVYQSIHFENEKYAVFTDPPYGFNYVKKSDQSSIQNDGAEFAEIIAGAISQVSAETMFICGDAKTAGEFLGATETLGKPKSLIVWVKPIQHRLHRFEPCHEFIWYWGHNGSPFYGANVFESKRAIEKYHPTVKPVDLVHYCLNSIQETNIVDMFAGSGTTLIACEQANKKSFLVELDPKYCDVIITRWETLTGQKAELLDTKTP
jgi:16S rRNA G966 N2-methylase RsmD